MSKILIVISVLAYHLCGSAAFAGDAVDGAACTRMINGPECTDQILCELAFDGSSEQEGCKILLSTLSVAEAATIVVTGGTTAALFVPLAIAKHCIAVESNYGTTKVLWADFKALCQEHKTRQDLCNKDPDKCKKHDEMKESREENPLVTKPTRSK